MEIFYQHRIPPSVSLLQQWVDRGEWDRILRVARVAPISSASVLFAVRGNSRHLPMLHISAAAAQIGLLEVFLLQGADPQTWASDTDRESVLYHAILSGHTPSVRLLLDHGVSLSASCWGDDNPPLIAVAASGTVEMAALLLDRGADVNGRSNGYFTALHKAARRGELEMVRFLLDRGANIDPSPSKTGYTNPPLAQAIENGHTEVALLLIERGADVNAAQGKTPEQTAVLTLAAFHNNLPVAAALLAKGAAVNRIDDLGGALSAAVYHNHKAMAEFLLQHKANPRLRAQGEKSVMQEARRNRRNKQWFLDLERNYRW